MNIEQLFSEALGVVSPWYIKSVNFNSEQKKLDIEVDFKKGSEFEDTDTKTYKAYDTIRKTWRHLNFFEHECYLHCRTPRIRTTSGTTRLIMPPWSGVMNGFTLLFEALIMKLAKQMPVNNVADLLKISDDKIWQMLDVYINAAGFNQDFSDIEVIGVDETSVQRGHQYISLFVDLKQKRTIFIAEGKDSGVITDFSIYLKEHNGCAKHITDVSCDMSSPAFIRPLSKPAFAKKL